MKAQLSTSFILPLMKFSNLISRSITQTYMGHADYEGHEVWGNYLYLQIASELLDDILLTDLRNHPQYSAEIDEKEDVLFAFKFTPTQKLNIVMPFLMGKYSEIDRIYVRDNFPMYTKNKSVSTNWRILCKDKWDMPQGTVPLRDYWSRRIGVQIPVENEVWPKPKMGNEIYNFYEQIVHQEVEEASTFNRGLVFENNMETH